MRRLRPFYIPFPTKYLDKKASKPKLPKHKYCKQIKCQTTRIKKEAP